MRLTTLLFLCLLFSCSNQASIDDTTTKTASRPNILYIMLDDLGFSDLGCYGSEISTPNIDALAAKGQKFSGFRTAPMCGPTRAMMISGNSNHIEGMGRMINPNPKNARYKGLEHYEEDISDRIVAFPKLLQQAGYSTSFVGKWHLGWEDKSLPSNHGFDNTWALRNAVGNYWNARNYTISHPERIDSISYYFNNGQPVEYPEGTYATEWYTDKMIQFLKKEHQENKDKPFFAFASYTSPHWPLQAPQAYWDKYKGKYNDGYQALMEKRLKGLKEKGAIAPEINLPPYPDMQEWDNLTKEEKKYEARKMEIFAGMVENVDFHIGRIIQYLKETDQYENTIIVVHSDNGAAAEDLSKGRLPNKGFMSWNDNSFNNMNNSNSFIALGSNWAQASSVPFRKYKQKMYEGSMASPFIIAGKGIPQSTKVRKEFFCIQDIAPTFLDIGGVTYPSEWEDKTVEPQRGTSFLPYIQQKAAKVHEEDFIFAIEHRRTSFLRKGNWKITNQEDSANNGLFKLFNIKNDFSEQQDLATEQPEKLSELLVDWEQYKKDVGVIFLEKLD